MIEGVIVPLQCGLPCICSAFCCQTRHMHVLQCFLCGRFPTTQRDSRAVVFCSICPRKACLFCQETRISRDRSDWVSSCFEKSVFGTGFCRPCPREDSVGKRLERVLLTKRLRAPGGICCSASSRCSRGEGRNGFGHVDPVRRFSRE